VFKFNRSKTIGTNEDGSPSIQRGMEIEQKLPNGPNFFLIVILFCVTILIIFGLALFFVHFDGKHLTFRHHSAHPTSQSVYPGGNGLAIQRA
jgi:hypothetical protein